MEKAILKEIEIAPKNLTSARREYLCSDMVVRRPVACAKWIGINYEKFAKRLERYGPYSPLIFYSDSQRIPKKQSIEAMLAYKGIYKP